MTKVEAIDVQDESKHLLEQSTDKPAEEKIEESTV
jgi:hypothetical protein